MAALDFHGIATALATAFGNVTAPSGMRAIALATAQPANAIGNTPAIAVMPQEGSIVVDSAGTKGEHDFACWFLYDRREGDQMRYATALQKWLGPLLLATYGAAKLGLAPVVMKAIPTEYEVGVVTFGGVEYEGIKITVRVYTEQTDRLTP